jgi:hypothetical protein
VKRQFIIANRFLAGQWFKLWGYIPFFPSMDKTSEMYAKIIGKAGTIVWNGPVGVFENDAFAKGTETIARAIADAESKFAMNDGPDTVRTSRCDVGVRGPQRPPRPLRRRRQAGPGLAHRNV